MLDNEHKPNPDDQDHRKRLRRHACPACGRRSLVVIHRRTVDRLINRFFPLRRYRCSHHECLWEGVLPSSDGRKKLQAFWQGLWWGGAILVSVAVSCMALFYLLREG